MILRHFWLWLALSWLLAGRSFAQLTVSSPVARMVFQRSLQNEATVPVAGLAPATATMVEARFVPMAVGQGTVTAWTSLPILPGSSAFRGAVSVPAGWYRLDVRTRNGTTLLAETHVNRVGVGEVFVVAGQSNAYGGFERVPDAADDRVSCVDFRQDSLSEQLLPLQFSHVSYGTSIGPSQPPHLWGVLGDRLVRRLNVPVLFLGAALGATSSGDWQQSAAGNIGPTPASSVYRRLGAVLLHYVARTGARAVLWHQGESDPTSSTQTYYDNIRYVIEKSRQQTNSGGLPWMVSRVSYNNNQTNPAVIAAQNQLIADVPQVFAGPVTDDLTGPENRADGVHFQGLGLIRFTDRWEQSLTNQFFQNAIPFTPASESALLTSGYTLPLTRRPGETLVAASLRSDPSAIGNQYVVQVVRAENGVVVHSSSPGTDNPLLVTLPADLPDGEYRLRTLSTQPALTGTLGEPFRVQQSASASSPPNLLRPPVSGGTADPVIDRFGYRYEVTSHGFFAMVRATAPVEVRLQRIDGGSFGDSGWNVAPPSAQAPDYTQFADFNYLRNYPPIALAVGGVEPGRYRLSVRRQGDGGDGLWYEMLLLDGRNILYYPMEPIGPVPPVLTATLPPAPTCSGDAISVGVEVSDGVMNGENQFSVRLSDSNGSFANETVIGNGPASPVSAMLPANLPPGTNYRIRVVGSSPAVASAPTGSLTLVECGPADLALSVRVDDRTPDVGQPITLTVVVTNQGPAPANGVVAKTLLPVGLAFAGTGSSAISAANGAVVINAGSVANGADVPFVFQLNASQSGQFAASFQIAASNQQDPDSKPDSGTGDGQDDAATLDLRTADGIGPLLISPNPNQTPLPPVQSSQPLPDPAQADLSLGLMVNKLTLAVNEVVDATLTVSNRGGSAADNVTVQVRLPVGWQLISPAGLSVSGQLVTVPIGAVPADGVARLVLSIRVGGTGIVQAQLQSATPTDPDSQPGNGYQNGEDDQASAGVRVR